MRYDSKSAELGGSSRLDLWIACQRPNRKAKARLFCFPYAGGGSQVFQRWHEDLPENIEVCSIQLPGRETRISEPPVGSLLPLTMTLADELIRYLDKPFAFFGHSMGGLMCFELTHQIVSQYGLSPHHLFISGCRAPHLSSLEAIHELPDPEFLNELRNYGATPEEVLTDNELMQLLLPRLRADFSLVGTYKYTKRAPLNCPITTFGGTRDGKVDISSLKAWRCHTDSSFVLNLLPGDHFFLHSNRLDLLRKISVILRSSLLVETSPPD